MKPTFALTTALSAIALLSSLPAQADPIQRVRFNGACRTGEKWTIADAAQIGPSSEEYVDEFRGASRSQPVRSFSQAISLRVNARTSAQRALGEYWISRALWDAKLAHIAWNGFQALVDQKPTASSAPFQLAALACMNEIQSRYPALRAQIDASSIAAIRDSLAEQGELDPGEREIVAGAALSVLLRDLESSPTGKQKSQAVLGLLEGSGPYESLARGLAAAKTQDRDETVKQLNAFFAESTLPEPLKRHTDAARLISARMLYALGRPKDAAEQIKKVRKSSNELVTSLSELSWAHLMADDYNEAIGAATSLQSGKLRGTFAPEAPMVMSMALNELCQYPESVRAIQTFRKNYESSYNWLADTIHSHPDYYRMSIDYLKKKGTTPQRVASEWVRSPLFISSQDEINLLFDERKFTESLNASGRLEQRKLADEILKSAHELRPKIKAARQKLQESGSLPSGIQSEIASLRQKINLFRRIGRAAPTWKRILSNHRARVPKMESTLISRINTHLDQVAKRMLLQIAEVAENVQLIEVEILNGASHDLIWQNAHPDYRQFARDLKDSTHSRDAAKVWDWGHIAVGKDEESEVWEDELGSFKADLEDNCGSKDKYLAVKLRTPAGARSERAGTN